MKKTAFGAGFSGLHEFTHMPFGLSNAGSSFCHLMQLCLGDKHFVTLSLYLDDLCIFAMDIELILDHGELVFNRLKEFQLKIKSKKCHFLTLVFCFSIMCYQLGEFQLTLKSRKVANPH